MSPQLRPFAAVFGISVIAGFSLLVSPASAEVRFYNCVLSPRQVVPLVTGSRATGAGRFIIDTDANTVSYWIVFTKLGATETVAHIHGNFISSPGINADIRHTLPAGNPKIGVWHYTEDLEAMILSGYAYADIHTAANTGGELRGQIVPYSVLLDKGQQIPASTTTGDGWAAITIDKPAHQLTYYISYAGLSGAVTGAHFHGPALHAATAGVMVSLAPGPSPMTGTVGYAPADEPALLGGGWYVDLVTALNPSGEIRGQLCPLVVPMDATQTVPPNLETGSEGFVLVSVDTLANVLSYDVHIDSVRTSQTAEHIHGFASVGANAGAVVTLFPGARRLGSWTYGAANESELLLGHAYVDSHTSGHPGGELRGQITRLPGSSPLLAVDGPPHAMAGLVATPNPFASRTRLSFQLARAGSVSLSFVDVEGRLVRRIAARRFDSGPHTFEWDGRDDIGRTLPPGLYFARVHSSDGETVTRLSHLR